MRQMLQHNQTSSIVQPFKAPPDQGTIEEVAPGILWARIPLPFRLNHVNVFLIEDGDGWAVLDTGINNDVAKASWQQLLEGPLAGQRLTRIIVSHFHPDHIGLAGWLCDRFDAPLLTGNTTYFASSHFSSHPGAMETPLFRAFFERQGMSPEIAHRVTTDGYRYLDMVAPLPPTFERIVPGVDLKIGRRTFEVMAGEGHAPEQIILYCRAENVLLVADQVLMKISPNVSVWALAPDDDPLGLYLSSLRKLTETIDSGALILPGHHLPFVGLHERCEQLIAHHHERCELLQRACAASPHSIAELVPVIFSHITDPHQLGFAFSETHAHVNYLLHAGTLARIPDEDGISRLVAT